MDWAKAIEINRTALTRIVLGLIAMIGLSGDGTLAGLPRPLYLMALAVLRPVESAVRRLIVIAARGLEVKPSAVRPMPKGLAITRKGSGRISFSLFDPPKRYVFPRLKRPVKVQPRILVFCAPPPLSPLFQLPPAYRSAPVPAPKPKPEGGLDAQRLGRRLAAVKMALDTLPRQALRLARWRARQDKTVGPRFGSPLRRGLPPGWRDEPQDEADRVLKDCDALARRALDEDTS